MFELVDGRSGLWRSAVVGASLSLTACGGESARENGARPAARATGGASTNAGGTGGDSTVGLAGTAASNGGTSTSADDGATSGDGGTTSPSGGAGMNPCAKVTCPALPNTCQQIVQDPNECCPTCADTGCGACPDLDCSPGTHIETAPGDCCPSCVADPPDACTQGHSAYADLRTQILQKYQASGCQNSADCALATEDDACAYSCDIPLPSSTVSSFTHNLENAANGCASCTPPARTDCAAQVPACVNGHCAAAYPGR